MLLSVTQIYMSSEQMELEILKAFPMEQVFDSKCLYQSDLRGKVKKSKQSDLRISLKVKKQI